MIAYLESEASPGWRTEIANMAGVSQSTAWHALGRVNRTNQKVAEAIKKMYNQYNSNDGQI